MEVGVGIGVKGEQGWRRTVESEMEVEMNVRGGT